jgi:NADPH2:quinone reductase
MTSAIRVHQTGGPEVLRWEGVEVAAPEPHEVVLRQHAVGLNFIDIYHRTGLYPQPLPFTPGVEGAGVVETVGADVTHLSLGDRVVYAGPIGAYAERRLIAADRLVKLPDDIDFETAAAAMLQGMTVRMLVRSVYPVQSGDTILVHAAAGGVGLLLCQWAASLGATVIGTVSTDAKAELARAHGCHHPIIYTQEDFVAAVEHVTGGKKVAVAYDSVGRDTFLRSLDCIRRRGMMVSFGQASGPMDPLAPALLAQKGSLFLTRPTLFDYIAEPEELQESADELFAMILSGKLKVEVKQRFSLKDAAQAHRALESRATTGSTVLTV